MIPQVYISANPGSIEALEQAFDRYVELSRKTPAQALDKQGRELSVYLYDSLSKVTPSVGKSGAAAEARGFRVGRKKFGGRLSPVSYRLADDLMGGQPAVYGKVTRGVGSFGIIRTVRVGRRGKRITGGRRGRGGTAATFEQGKAMKLEGEKPMNRRAVATFFELQKREAGRRYLASSFLLFRRQRNRADARAKGNPYKIVRTSSGRTSIPWHKSAELRSSSDGARFELLAGADGVTKFPARVAEGIEATRRNMLTYINRKVAEDLAKSKAK